MITFIDGPAKGQRLMLRRGVVFLRAARSSDGGKEKWDGLDQLQDTPEPGEELFAYEAVGNVGWCHIRASSPARSGMYAAAEYKLVQPQPADAEMRDNDAWAKWVGEEAERRGLA